MTDQLQPLPGEFLLYETEDGRTRVECRFVADTLWLPQAGMAELFQTSKQNVAKHLKAIFAEGELRPEAVVNQWLTTASDGKNYRVAYYSLEAILAVGYRVRSPRGTQFRRWATERLAEYLVKGFTLDDERLKNPPVAGSAVPDRFDELLERIRDIRASERRMYLRVREIFSMAADYSPTLPETTQFFRFIQNKLHFAIHGHTAAELIVERADSDKEHMGLTSWERAPDGKIIKTDVTVAKNYLEKEELESLGRIVNAWLDLAREATLPVQVTEEALRRTEQRSVVLQLERLMDYPMVRQRVASAEALGQVEGVGPARVARYGAPFVALLAAEWAPRLP